jgi:septal ring factor EnvC (AmiA/AmiB activator)
MNVGDWVGIGALVTTVLVALFGFLTKPAFVASSRLQQAEDDLGEARQMVRDLRQERQDLQEENRRLRRENQIMMRRVAQLDRDMSNHD